MQLPTYSRVVSRKPRRNDYANLRENCRDISCYWRNRGQQYGPSRSVVRPSSSSLLPSSLLRLSTALLPSSLLCLLSSPPPSSALVSLLKGALRPPTLRSPWAAFFFASLISPISAAAHPAK